MEIRRLLTIAVLVLAFSSHGDAAEYYEEAEPKDARGQPYAPPTEPTVCQTYLSNINYFARRNQPLNCERPIAPGLTGLARVDWQPLDVKKHRVLFERMARGWFCKQSSTAVEACVRAVEAKVASGDITLLLAAINIDQDYEAERILKYQPATSCSPSQELSKQFQPRPTFFLINETLTDFAEILAGPRDNLFLYRGRAYGEEYDSSTGSVWVSEADLPARFGRSSPLPLCERRFLSDQCPPNSRPDFRFFRVCELAVRAKN